MILSHSLYDSLNRPGISFHVPMFIAKQLFEPQKVMGWRFHSDLLNDDLFQNEDGSSGEVDNKVVVTVLDVPCQIGSAVVSYLYITTKHWMANNVFGMAFSVQGISLLNLDTFVTGAILLVCCHVSIVPDSVADR